MGTLQTVVTDARYKVRDSNGNQYSDAEVLAAVNIILHEIHDKLSNIESNLVYGHSTITLADGTKEYTPSFSHQGFLNDGVWLDGNEWYLTQTEEPDRVGLGYEDDTLEGEPRYYYLTEDGKVGFIDTPDAIYTCHVYYWKPLTELTAVATDTLPWNGIWNTFIHRRLIMDLLERNERDTSRQAVLASMAETQAMNRTYNLGTRRRKVTSDFFDIDGL